MGKHTPGPWNTDNAGYRVLAKRKGFKPTPEHPVFVVAQCSVYCCGDREEQSANARLIAAAPELLNVANAELVMLSRLNTVLESETLNEDQILDRVRTIVDAAIKRGEARAAIAKATGEDHPHREGPMSYILRTTPRPDGGEVKP